MKKIGYLGEDIIAQYLVNNGYEILDRAWHSRWGEIDIIAQKSSEKILIFVEVKTRNKRNWDNDGMYAISLTKQKKLWLTAESFLSQNPTFANFNCRFDVALLLYQKNLQSEDKFLENIVFNGMNIYYKNYIFNLFNYIENAFSYS
ncbi:YraN family protein [Geminocystis sp. CENA526]|uniref:YraN family protein n=1 Tax=Geminocystis sp. CENA526 TaxID=1355871 RepID=UPI003D6E083E